MENVKTRKFFILLSRTRCGKGKACLMARGLSSPQLRAAIAAPRSERKGRAELESLGAEGTGKGGGRRSGRQMGRRMG